MEKDKIFKIFDEHFIKDMLMTPAPKKDERHYNDEHLYIIFVWIYGGVLYTEDKLRILIKNWKTNKSFSLSISSFEIPFTEKNEDIVSFIKEIVYQNSGVESRDLLNDWYEIKKVEIRDKKISDLGI